jgi:hypothetical protein
MKTHFVEMKMFDRDQGVWRIGSNNRNCRRQSNGGCLVRGLNVMVERGSIFRVRTIAARNSRSLTKSCYGGVGALGTGRRLKPVQFRAEIQSWHCSDLRRVNLENVLSATPNMRVKNADNLAHVYVHDR